jgi:Ca-activated chloride channel family protein
VLEVTLGDFHFLRPQWLWALLPTLLLYVLLSRRLDPRRRWRSIIAPHLLDHLVLSPSDRWRLRPMHLFTAVALLATTGVSGPTWEREVSPFAEDTAPLVIALDLSRSMDAIDVQPSRVERAKQKIRDLVALRPGARTSLVVYAGSAHIVLPLSTDASMFDVYLDGLGTAVMPVPGKDPTTGLALADSLLARDSVPGSILFVTDGISEAATAAFVAHEARSTDAVLVLAVGTSQGGPVQTGENEFATDDAGRRIVATLDREGLDALATETSAFVAGATVDSRDVERLDRRIQSNLRRVQQEDETARWKDAGYWLLYPIALFALLSFRKGWTVRWSAVALVALLGACAPTAEGSGASPGFRFIDLWLTPDQQGRRFFEAGRYAEAADRFEDPRWRAAAAYRAEAYDDAILAWALVDEPEAHFGTGNAYARRSDYESAVAAYDRALAHRPGWAEARENRDYVQSLIPPPPEESADLPEAAPPPTFEADSVDVGNDEQRGQQGEVPQELLTDDQLAELWLRRLQPSPSEFLRRRFLIEQQRRSGGEGES